MDKTIYSGIIRTLLRAHPGHFQHVHVVCSNEACVACLMSGLISAPFDVHRCVDPFLISFDLEALQLFVRDSDLFVFSRGEASTRTFPQGQGNQHC